MTRWHHCQAYPASVDAAYPADNVSRARAIPPRAGRTIWAVLGFLLLFTTLVVMVSRWYLLPGLARAQHMTHDQRREMAAHALLLMAVLLTVLACGLMLTFRIGRHLFPRRPDKPVRTRYVDAWAEAGRRAEVDDDPAADGEPHG